MELGPDCTSVSAGDWPEQQFAHGDNHDVHEANRDVPEQHGQRRDTEMNAERLRVGKEEKSNEQRRDGNETRNGELLKKSQHQEHESPDTLEEISDGGWHDLADFRQRIGRLIFDVRTKELDELGIASVGKLPAHVEERFLPGLHHLR